MPDYNSLPDYALANLLKQGDELAYTEIFNRYKVLLYKHAYRLLNSQEQANDIIQDMFLALWQKRALISLKTSLAAYLYSAIRNRIFDHLSHQKVAAKYVDAIKQFIDQGVFVTDEQVRFNELSKIIEREIAALPPKMRVVFELSRNTDLSYREIGAQLNISDKTVKQQVHNAVRTLRLRIKPLMILLPFL